MIFGKDSSQAPLIKWYWAAPGAKDLGFPTPFVSRNWDQWEIWPEVGEVAYASRNRTDGSFPIVVPGTGKPCGDPVVWARGTIGTPQPIYPRNQFGLAACCGGLLDRAGEPILGLDVQVGFSVDPLPLPSPAGLEWTIDDNLADMCGTLEFVRRAVYPPPWIGRRIEVDELDDSDPQKKLIFGER